MKSKAIVQNPEKEGFGQPAGRRIGHNSVYLIIRTVIIMLISLYTSRLALQLLGVTDFGIYSVVAGFVIFFGFLNNSMERSITRYLLYEKGIGTPASLNRMFNVAMIAQICIVGVVLLLGETIGLWYVNHHLNVPAEKMEATNWVYQLSLVTLCFNIIKVPYNAMIVAYEKMSFYAIFAMAEVVLRLACLFSLLLFTNHLLIIYAAQFLAVTIVVVASYKIYCCHAKIFGRVCRFQWLWNKTWFRQLITFCGWSILSSSAALGALQGVSLILNHFYGVNINSAFGLALMVQNAVYAILVSFQTAFSPKLVSLYAQQKLLELRSFILKLGKYCFYLSAFLLVPLCLNINEALDIWLGDDVPQYTGIFCVFVMISNGLDCLAFPALVCNQATGKVRNFNILWSLLLIANLPVSYGLIAMTDWAPVALVVRIAMTFISYVFMAVMMKLQINLNPLQYIADSLLKPLVILVPALLGAATLYYLMGSGFLSTLINALAFWSLFGILIYFFGINAEERTKVAKFISDKLPLVSKLV